MIETTDHGYVLRVAADAVDAHAVRRPRSVPPAGCSRRWPSSSTSATGRAGRAARRGRRRVDQLDDVLARLAGGAVRRPARPPRRPRGARPRSSGSGPPPRRPGSSACWRSASTPASWPRTESATARDPMDETLWAIHALALVRCRSPGRRPRGAARRPRPSWSRTPASTRSPELAPWRRRSCARHPALDRPADEPRRRPPRRRSTPRSAPGRQPPGDPTVGRQASARCCRPVLDRPRAGPSPAGRWSGNRASARPGWSPTWPTRRGEQGFAVAWGRCSQDDGAPPLWPWRAVLEAPGRERGPDDVIRRSRRSRPQQVAFADWDRIVRRVRAAAGVTPAAGRCSRTCTGPTRPPCGRWPTCSRPRRPIPASPWSPPVGASPSRRARWPLVGEAFARRHAARVEVTGLEREGTTALLAGRRRGPCPIRCSTPGRALGRQPVLPRRAGPAGSGRP